MSKIQFIATPFPDNHDGFDYSPASFTDVQRELDSDVAERESQQQEKKLLSMLTSVFK